MSLHSLIQRFLIAAFVVAIIIGGYLALRKQKGPAPDVVPVTTSASTATTATTTVPNADQVLEDDIHGFSISYAVPLVFTPVTPDTTDSWRTNTQDDGNLVAQGSIDRSFQPQTNFSGATLSIGYSPDPKAVSTCLKATDGESAKGLTTIGGTIFHSFSLGDAGAGNYYDTTSYRSIHNGQCFSVEYTIHSTSIASYSPDQGIKAFDLASVTSVLDHAVNSFIFLKSPTSR